MQGMHCHVDAGNTVIVTYRPLSNRFFQHAYRCASMLFVCPLSASMIGLGMILSHLYSMRAGEWGCMMQVFAWRAHILPRLH